ncbi:MAG TPA: hypothetical protein VN850_03775 [Candidatus Acidoferrales bacterium]|jgi:hypothetical protein|nr:hypothetical protein [Candidatus Acidoferrales bacterium]
MTTISTRPAGAAANNKIDVGQFICKGRSFGGARFFEFHDRKWFPKSLRDGVTDALQFILSLGGIYRPIVPLLNKAVEATRAARIVDLCSGGGGPWLWLYRLLCVSDERNMEVCLTDKYPNIAAFENARRKTGGRITFYPGFVDAACLPRELAGFRTIFTSFHHFTPDEAVAILQNAADGGQGIGVFEAAKRDPLTILLTVLMPLVGFLTAPVARPFRISRIFWTYVIPVIPFVLFFDGVISCLRAYSQKELSVLAAQVQAENYVWQIGEQSGGLAPITFLLGYPNPANAIAHTELTSSEPTLVK